MPVNDLIAEKPLPRSEWLAAMTIFLIPFLIPGISYLASTGAIIPKWLNYLMLTLFGGAVIFALGLAVVKGLPRWSFSYLGFLLMLGLILARYDRIWSWIYPHFVQLFGPRSIWPLSVRILYAGIFETIMLLSLLLSALILVNLLRLLPYSRDVWQRIRIDWTQLSFVFYGGLVLGVLLLFDEYHYEQVWQFMAWVCLALGAWIYLRAPGRKARLLALPGGVTGAMWTVAFAKWTLIPLQKWPIGYPVSPSEATRWTETGSAILAWVVIILMMLAPALLGLLPSKPDPIAPEAENLITV